MIFLRIRRYWPRALQRCFLKRCEGIGDRKDLKLSRLSFRPLLKQTGSKRGKLGMFLGQTFSCQGPKNNCDVEFEKTSFIARFSLQNSPMSHLMWPDPRPDFGRNRNLKISLQNWNMSRKRCHWKTIWKSVHRRNFPNKCGFTFNIRIVSSYAANLPHVDIAPDILFSTSFNWQSEQSHENKKSLPLFFQTIGFYFMTFFRVQDIYKITTHNMTFE